MRTAEALELLRRYVPRRVEEHCLAVAELVEELGQRISGLNLELALAGALLHDIGRSVTHSPAHGYEGAKLLRRLGVDERIARIAERHVGAGIAADEAPALGLPPRDFLPETREEKLVAYADNLIMGTKRVNFERSLERFRSELGEEHPSISRFLALHREVRSWLNSQEDLKRVVHSHGEAEHQQE
ncbi:MAG: TIGR00295 family protein [Euryarchaeota archaeon]|nr:TIGR00295 family protein [Euryarchaeota archaeon]